MIILNTSEEGLCFVETKNLDGETDLKRKVIPRLDVNLAVEDFRKSVVSCELPSNKIYSFSGVIQFPEKANHKVSLQYENFLLRGCSLRNTDYVVGVVTYVGSDTKIMLNSTRNKSKYSNLEKLTGYQILLVLTTMILCCACAAVVVVDWNTNYDVSTNQYLDFYPIGVSPP